MSQETYFEQYLQIVGDGIKKIRKISFKKINLINQLINTLSNYLSKEVYGRIEPVNYLLLFIMALGSKNSKLYGPIIQTIQKIISNNYINPNDDLSSSLRLVKEEHKEFLILPFEDYSNKTFQQIYIETLIALPQKNEAINLLISKNMSLIFRLSQSYLPVETVKNICDFLVQSILTNKSIEFDPILKSSFLEIVRHAVQSLKETSDKKLLEQDEDISMKKFCHRYGQTLADQVAIRIEVQQKYDVKNYEIIPQNINGFTLKSFTIENEKKEKSGKFGWCIMCRKTANFYCRIEKVPVCGYDCKQEHLQKYQQLEKQYGEEFKSMSIFSKHIQAFCKQFDSYLGHPDIRKREVFAGIFLHLSSQLRKIPVKSMTLRMKNGIKKIFKQCCYNIVLESEAFIDCLKSSKKLMPLKISVAQTAILLHQLAQKLTHFITPGPIKVEILKFCNDLIRSDLMFQCFMELDCNSKRKDAVKELISAVSQLYIGIKPPQGINLLPPEEPHIRNLALQVLHGLIKAIKASPKHLDTKTITQISQIKKQKNALKKAIQRFNETEKPTKVIKKLIAQKYFRNDPQQIAHFLHKHLKRLSFVNVGQLIGDWDPLAISIRDHFIGQLNFKGHLVDEGLRILLSHFTIPGESQVVERIIQCFSNVYYRQNKEDDKQQIFTHSDAVYSFSYLLMMLQTNLHNPQVVEKMTLAQFSNLSKNMNGQGSQFPQKFLQTIYKSIQAKQLGFHSKHKQMEIINAYQQKQIKKAQQIHTKELQAYINRQFSHLRQWDDKTEHTYDKFCVRLLSQELFGDIIDAISVKIRQSEEKDELIKNIDQIQGMIKFSLSLGIQEFVSHGIKCLWEQITKVTNNTIKKYMLYEKLLGWVREYTLHIYDQWGIVINLFSNFHRVKAIKKDNTGKNNIIVVVNDRSYLYDSYVSGIIVKSSKFNMKNLKFMTQALIQSSKQEIAENHTPFSLQKIGQMLQSNNSRLAEILPNIWPKLKEHYIQLGCHKSQKVALFGTDFLKQLITKFLKKKDLLFYQKDYLRPFQQIFNSNVELGVKQYIVGGLSYFVNNYFQNIKEGWKIILAILCDSFDEDENAMVKDKSHGIVRKIYQSNFLVMDIDENYVDFVQILGRMARQKDQAYPKSCIDAIQTITNYYHKKLAINLDNPTAPENQKLDINFWQTMWLPLLSTIYGICGDFRLDVQSEAIECMFEILMKYGKLFKYEFWKMIMQGILRPTFEEITYTSQSKPLPKGALEDWLRTSFSLLFVSINKLICMYFNDFKLFLPDILKIYQSCILSNSNKILTQLSTEALSDLLSNVGEQFENMNWTEYIDFVEAVSRKGFPYELESAETWKKSQHDSIQNSYQGKCLTMNLILINCQTILQKFSDHLLEKDIKQIEDIITKTYEFCRTFNRNIQLRELLWKNGFFAQMKSLPGLVKHEHQALKGITISKYKLSKKSEVYMDQYAQHILKLLGEYKKCLITDPPKQVSLQLQEQQRQCTMFHIIIIDTVFKHIETIGLPKLVQLGYQQFLLDNLLDCMAHKTYCSKCKFCITCESSGERQSKFTEQAKNLIKELFTIRQK